MLHDDVIDHSDSRRGISSLNFIMGNKVLIKPCIEQQNSAFLGPKQLAMENLKFGKRLAHKPVTSSFV